MVQTERRPPPKPAVSGVKRPNLKEGSAKKKFSEKVGPEKKPVSKIVTAAKGRKVRVEGTKKKRKRIGKEWLPHMTVPGGEGREKEDLSGGSKGGRNGKKKPLDRLMRWLKGGNARGGLAPRGYKQTPILRPLQQGGKNSKRKGPG